MLSHEIGHLMLSHEIGHLMLSHEIGHLMLSREIMLLSWKGRQISRPTELSSKLCMYDFNN